MNNKFKQMGFTLLEILIALFIFTIISIIMTQALHIALTSLSGTEKSAARMRDLQMTLLMFSRDFEQIIDRPVINALQSPEASLLGSADNITFTHSGLANPQGEILRSTLQRTQYSLLKENIIRTTWDVLDQTANTHPQQRELAGSVRELHFMYLDDDGNSYSSWPPPSSSKISALPKAIRVTLTLPKWGKLSQLYITSGHSLDAIPS